MNYMIVEAHGLPKGLRLWFHKLHLCCHCSSHIIPLKKKDECHILGLVHDDYDTAHELVF